MQTPTTQQPAIPKLPSPASVFQPDPATERILRIAAVERELLAEPGPHPAPVRLTSGAMHPTDFANAFDATIQRRWAARPIVENDERAARYGTTPEYEAKIAELPTSECGRPLIRGRAMCARCDVEAA